MRERGCSSFRADPMLRVVLAVSLWLAAGCAVAPRAGVPRDGDLAVPANYKSWTAVMLNLEREDLQQVRDIYVNDAGATLLPGGSFPNGTLAVMEVHRARVDSAGSLVRDAAGRLVKGELTRVFVMGKDALWGQDPADLPRNGNWIYSAYLADARTRSPDPPAACRSCHLADASIGAARDYFARYEEFLARRK